MAHCRCPLRDGRRVVGVFVSAMGCGLSRNEPAGRDPARQTRPVRQVRVSCSLPSGPRSDCGLRSPDRLDGVGGLSSRTCPSHPSGLRQPSDADGFPPDSRSSARHHRRTGSFPPPRCRVDALCSLDPERCLYPCHWSPQSRPVPPGRRPHEACEKTAEDRAVRKKIKLR
jgi:hypothetical protein